MAAKGEVTIGQVFGLMDRWRHLPAYQLERRADVFFALFLPEVLGKHFDVEVSPLLIPEFPVKKRDNNQSNNVDYLALEQPQDGNPKRAFLVELKTDMGSRRQEQDRVLRCAVDRGMKKLILGVLEICRATNDKPKYVHLLKLLSEVGLVEYRDGLWPVRQGFSRILDEVEAKVEQKVQWPSLEVVYVQPLRGVIDFNEFAEAIEGQGDIGRLFARSLREWTAPSGSPDPKDVPV